MKAVMLKRPVAIHNQTIPAWVPHLLYDQTFEILLKAVDRRDVLARDVKLPLWDGTGTPEKLLVFGGGGTGDRVQQTPGLRKLAGLLGHPVDIAAGKALEWVGLPYIGNVYDWMLPEHVLNGYDCCCSFEDILGHQDERETHLAELFARRLHVDPLVGGETANDPQEYRCDWAIQPCEPNGVPLPDKDTRWVAMQVKSNGFSRNWPLEHVVRLAEMIGAREGWTCLIIGAPGELQVWRGPENGWSHAAPEPPDGVVNLCGQFPSIRQLAVFLARCDLLIGPDSGPMHMAGALGIPSIGLYGPHTYDTRGKWFAKQVGMTTEPIPADDRCPCYCHTDQTHGQMPCGHQYCQLLQAITPEAVMAQAEVALAEHRGPTDADSQRIGAPHGVVGGSGDTRDKRPRRRKPAVPGDADGPKAGGVRRTRARQPAGPDTV